MHKGIRFPPKLEIINSRNHVRMIHFKTQKASQFILRIIARMFSPSKVVEDKVHSFIDLVFPSFKTFKGSRNEIEVIVELE